MNIDEFLDNEVETKEYSNSDDINLNEEYTGDASNSPERLENSTFKQSDDDSLNLESEDEDESAKSDNNSNQSKFDSDNISKISSFKDKFVSHVNSVQRSISRNDLVKSMDNLKELIFLSRDIPESKIDVKHKSDTTILALNSKILEKAQELRLDFESHARLISKLLVKVQVELKSSNVEKVVLLYRQIMSVYNALSDDFTEEKLALNDKILRLQSAMNELKIKTSDYKFKSQKNLILNEIAKLDLLISSGDMRGADKQYYEIEDLFWRLPDDHYEEKLKLNLEILKKKSAVDLSLQINTLQNELQTHTPKIVNKKISDLRAPVVPSHVYNSKISSSNSVMSQRKINVSSPQIPNNTKQKSETNSENIKNIDSLQKSNESLVSRNNFVPKNVSLDNPKHNVNNQVNTFKKSHTNNSLNVPVGVSVNKSEAKPYNSPNNDSMTNSVHNYPENSDYNSLDNSVEEALKKISIAKVKIELVEGNHGNANALVNQLLTKYPNDKDVLFLKSQIKDNLNEPGVYAEKGKIIETKLGTIESELRQGNEEQALVDAEIVDQSSAYQDVMSKAGVDLERSAKNIAQAIVHKRVNAAKQFLAAGNNGEAKKNIERALRIDPKNSESLELMKRLK